MGSKRKAPVDTRKKRDDSSQVKHGPADKREPARKVETHKVDIRKGSKDANGKTGFISMPSLPLKPDRITLLLAAVLLLALAVRLLPLLHSITGGQVILQEYDPYYHMRRIVYTVEHFPITNTFDSYVNYPYGYIVGWPPLYDLISATVSLLAGLGHPDRLTIEVASSAVPVAMGVLSVLLIFYIIKDAAGKNAGLMAAFFMAILPASVFRTLFGYTDHHALEVLISLTTYFVFMRAVAYGKEEHLALSGLVKSRKALLYAVLAGMAIACMIFSWDGAPIFIGIIAAYAFVQYAYDLYNKESTGYLTTMGLVASIVALAIVTPLAVTSFAGRNLEVTPTLFSWFHVIFLMGMAAFFIVMGALPMVSERRRMPWFTAPAILIAGALALLLALKLALPQLFDALKSGIDYLMGTGSTVMATINEVEPLFYQSGHFSLSVASFYLSTVGLISVIGLLIYLFVLWGKKARNIDVFLLVWTVIILFLGLLQKRFIYLLGVNVSIFTGYAFYGAFKLSGAIREQAAGNAPSKKKSRSQASFITPAMVAVLVVWAIVIILPLVNTIALGITPDATAIDWNNACTWVKEHTPATSFTYAADEGTHPEYGVMSWWDYGNYILYRAERPAVANNFQTGVTDAARYFVAQDEASANTIVDKLNVRYVMIDLRMSSSYGGVQGGIFENMPILAGDDAESYHMSYRMPMPYGTKRMFDGSNKYYDSMYSRLFNGDGLGGKNPLGINVNGLQHYRLLYVTQGDDHVKVFEYVKGAMIKGAASTGAKIEIRLNVTMPDGDKTYYSSTTADTSGTYVFTVPYPTSGLTGAIKTGSEYTITSGTSSVSVQVSPGAVDNGETITVGGKL